MKRGKRIIISLVAVLLGVGIMQQHMTYAVASRLMSTGSIEESEDEGVDTDIPVQETPDIEDSLPDSSDSNIGDESGGSLGLNTDGQSEEQNDQNVDDQMPDSSGQDMDGQPSVGLTVIDDLVNDDQSSAEDGSQGNVGDSNEWADGSQDGVEDDGEWADGDDRSTDEWSGGGEDEWADEDDGSTDDENKADEAKTDGIDRMDLYVDGEEEYIDESSTGYVPSNSYYGELDQNYQTGAGLGSDIFLILAVICGITAIGLLVRKSRKAGD